MDAHSRLCGNDGCFGFYWWFMRFCKGLRLGFKSSKLLTFALNKKAIENDGFFDLFGGS